MVKRIGYLEAGAGCAWVGAMFFGATHPMVTFTPLDMYDRLPAGLMLFLVGSLIGVSFNIRHRQNPFSITGRLFNYISGAGSFALLFVALPILYAVSPVTVLTLLTAALLSLISLRVPDNSPIESFLPALAVLPVAARYVIGDFAPADQPVFWKWAEIFFAGVAIIGISVINRESERIVGAGPRAKWIWLHSLHSLLIALTILALHRGSEAAIVREVARRAEGAAMLIGLDTEASLPVEHHADSGEDRSYLSFGGTIAIVSAVWMAVKGGAFAKVLAGEPVSAVHCVFLGMLLAVGIWTIFDVEISQEDRSFGALAGIVWGCPLLFILGLSMLS